MPRKPKYVKPDDFDCILGGVTWRIKFVRRCQIFDRAYGSCNWNRKLIRIAYDVPDKEYADTLLHEMRHALTLADYVNEDWITQTSTEMAEALVKAGIGRKAYPSQ